MCGRYTHLYKWKQLHRLMGLTSPALEFKERYNVAPTQSAPAVRADGAGRSVSFLRWGLVPSWAKDVQIGNSLINARAEGIETKLAFRAAFRQRRCLVPVSGFYEWKKAETGGKQPFYITAADDEPLALAGLWESWRPPTPPPDETVESFTIITTAPNEMMARLHDRMPVVLEQADFSRWLDPKVQDSRLLLGLLKPYPSELLVSRPVSTRVNSPRNDDPACIGPPERESGQTFAEP